MPVAWPEMAEEVDELGGRLARWVLVRFPNPLYEVNWREWPGGYMIATSG